MNHKALALLAVLVHGISAFAPLTKPIQPKCRTPNENQHNNPFIILPNHHLRTTLQMGYQLPPSPKGPLDELKAILPTIGSGILLALFFASPLGSIFFVWSALYTFEAPCPSCGQLPVRALKNGEPTVCLNCGAFSRVNEKGDGLELCNNPNDIMNGGEGSLFDALFGGGMSDDFGVVDSNISSNRPSEEERRKVKRQGTIIDVEVERD
eukprot:scaffold35253_cov97-Cyclotella_meneghiniana.AAC.3